MSLGRFFVIVLLCVIAFFLIVAATGGPIVTGAKTTNTSVLSQQVQQPVDAGGDQSILGSPSISAAQMPACYATHQVRWGGA